MAAGAILSAFTKLFLCTLLCGVYTNYCTYLASPCEGQKNDYVCITLETMSGIFSCACEGELLITHN